MFLTKLKLAAACVLMLSAACVGAWRAIPDASAQDAANWQPSPLAQDEKDNRQEKPKTSEVAAPCSWPAAVG